MRFSVRRLLFACLALSLLVPGPAFAASVFVKGYGVTSFQIRNAAGQVIASGKTGTTVNIPVGPYVFAIGAATQNISVSSAGSNQVTTYPLWVKGSKSVVIGTGPVTVTGSAGTPFTVKLRTGGGVIFTAATGQSFDLMMDTYDLVMGPAKSSVTLNSANLSATVITEAITTQSASGSYTVRDYAQTGVVVTAPMGRKIGTWQGSYKVELPGNRRVTANVYANETTTAS